MDKCILCNKNNVKIILSEAAIYDKFIAREFFVRWVICKNCLLLFRSPQQDIKENFEFNLFKYGKDWFVTKKRLANQFNYIFSNLEFNNNHKKVLDIGCGSGMLLEYFKKNNFKVFGIEGDKTAANFTAKIIGKKNVFAGEFNDFYKKKKDNFDLIILSHILEHTANPVDFLKKNIQMLNSGGYIYIEVPYEIFYKILQPGFVVYEPILPFHLLHSYSFTPNAIFKLIEKVKLQVVAFSIYNIGKFNPEFMKSYKVMPAMRLLLKQEEHIPVKFKFNKINLNLIDKKLKEINKKSFKIHGNFNEFLKTINNQKIIIYGCGLHTNFLIKRFPLLLKQTLFFVDDNKNKYKKIIAGRKVKSPQEIIKTNFYKILISSSKYETEIYYKLKKIIPHIKIQTIYNDFR